MQKYFNILGLFVLAILISGCANQPVDYPKYRDKIAIAVSAETVSQSTEVPAEDHLIPESQVFVGGKGNAGATIASLLGPFGTLAGISIDRSRNESVVSELISELRIKFDRTLADALKRQAVEQRLQERFDVAMTEKAGDIKMLPSVRLYVKDEEAARVNFRVTVRFTDGETKDERSKNYQYELAETHKVTVPSDRSGWADNDSALLKKAADVAFDRLSSVILKDLMGEYRTLTDREKFKTVYFKSKVIENAKASQMVVLEEVADSYVLTPVFNGKPAIQHIFIADKKLVALVDQP